MGNQELNFNQDLRIASVQRGPKITLMVNGKKILAYEGESVHAALTATGIRNFRISKTGKPRGVFCGMGICYECLVIIDNIPDQRACMTMVRDNMEIITEVPFFQKQKPKENNMDGNE
ncbi:MAG: (2Fe-2S)-binding protein [Proteobacteria bacterium]|nr:(2Fe-2S)-binding protein [Pseudomonadota bacterium]MBU1697787.1 (2Fe-2S)-binding protein [Pseudomonadota bacterium]